MAYWWVNHKQTFEHEVRGGYLWSPVRNANGARNQSYESMQLAQVGDTVFSYAFGEIRAVGRVTASALTAPKPTEFARVGENWAANGWLVEVDFVPVPKPLRPKAHIQSIGPLLPARHSPLQQNGKGNQGCYLASISDALGKYLLTLTQADHLPALTTSIPGAEPGPDVLEDLKQIEADVSIPVTQRAQLAKARVGQGLFRKRVLVRDQACRVTGVTDKRLLIASHIKPWRASTNAERINGYNGVLLSPHIDALFDSHLMTFENTGRMHFHPSLVDEILERWHIDRMKAAQPFTPEQTGFLEHHRAAFSELVG